MKVSIEIGCNVSCYRHEDVEVPAEIVAEGEAAVREFIVEKAGWMTTYGTMNPEWDFQDNFRIVTINDADDGASLLDDLCGYPLSIDDCVMSGRTLRDIYQSLASVESALDGAPDVANRDDIVAALATVADIKRMIERDTFGRCKE